MCDSPLVLKHPSGRQRCADCFYVSASFGHYPDLFCDNPLISQYEGEELVDVLPYFSCRHFKHGPYDVGDRL